MTMKYGNEGMDCKKLMLCFLQKLWIVVLAAVIGAILGGGIYLLCHVVLNSNREYRAESKVYLDFAPDESGEIYQEYNGYTWNDLMSTQLILDTTMSYLPDSYTEEEVIAATKAEILSDLRLLTITITTADADRTAQILNATNRSLEDMGDREKEFLDIEVIKETEPKLVAVDERLGQAVLLGFLIALTVTILGMLLLYVFNDRIYVPGDMKSVTQVPFVGYVFASQKEKNSRGGKRTQEFLEAMEKDLEQNKAHLVQTVGQVEIFDLENELPITEQTRARLQQAGGILLVIPYAKITRASLAYRMEQLELLQGTISGIMIKDADARFLKWYYNHL